MKIKFKKKYVIWFWVGTAHSATPDEPPLLLTLFERFNTLQLSHCTPEGGRFVGAATHPDGFLFEGTDSH
jgi:hypothetical protein